jgi:hypothetical protein
MKTYIGTKIVLAEPKECQEDTHNSKAGDPGYEVTYTDGYRSWSPAAVFEAAYRETSSLPFGLAIEAMRRGLRVARNEWRASRLFCAVQMPDEQSCMTLPYFYMGVMPPEDSPSTLEPRVPYTPTHPDMMADDWYVVDQLVEEEEVQ